MAQNALCASRDHSFGIVVVEDATGSICIGIGSTEFGQVSPPGFLSISA